ncbi:alpha/beta fold hydrolase [Nocardia jiangxiensis]|uniref:Alpha/beta fold hydrolase n=1 Tax=Nocardia jiangxiensis TaxID=282685 RepID=A0ABW6S6N4_9NOCA
MSKRPSADDYIDADSRFTTVEGLNMHYKRAGTGPIVVLLHGSGSSLHGFGRVAELLASSFEVIRPDLPGFGLTGPRPDRDYRIRTYAKTVAAFLDSLDVPAASVVGNSLGGNIAWNFALDYPSRVQRLVLINATGYPDKSLPLGLRLARHPVTRMLLRRMASRSATERNLRGAVGPGSTIVDEAMVDRVHAMMMRPGNQDAFIDFANTDQVDRTGEIPEITAPTLILRSGMIDGQHFARDIAGSRESTSADGGHLLPEEAPEWVAAAIRDFLTGDPLGGQGASREPGR